MSAFSRTQANFVQPVANGFVTVLTTDTSWMTPQQEVFCGNGGYYLVFNIVSNVSVVLQNRGYAGNASAGATVPSNSKIVPAGLRGPAGVDTTVNRIFYSAVDPNGVITAVRPAICYSDTVLWVKTNADNDSSGWVQIPPEVH